MVSLQVSVIDEQIEDNLFCMLDEETDSEYVEDTHLNINLMFDYQNVEMT